MLRLHQSAKYLISKISQWFIQFLHNPLFFLPSSSSYPFSSCVFLKKNLLQSTGWVCIGYIVETSLKYMAILLYWGLLVKTWAMILELVASSSCLPSSFRVNLSLLKASVFLSSLFPASTICNSLNSIWFLILQEAQYLLHETRQTHTAALMK